MKKIVIFLIFYLNQICFAQTVELICLGEIETKLENYKGIGKTRYSDQVKLEVTFDSKLRIVKRVYSNKLLLSFCFFSGFDKNLCHCVVDTDSLMCSLKTAESSNSAITINRKTGIANVIEKTSSANPSDTNTKYTSMTTGEIPCEVFSNNKF